MTERTNLPPEAMELIEAIIRKLKANHDVLLKSLDHGSVNWDRTKDGDYKVNLQPRI